MLLCLIALLVFSVLSLFSAKYKKLAKEAWKCAFNAVTLRPCDASAANALRVEVVSALAPKSKTAARFVNKHFLALSYILVFLTFASFAYSAVSIYNFYFYGNCEGPQAKGACILNDITGDYGRFKPPGQLTPPDNYDGLSFGNPSAPIKIIEFGCFTCPYTKEAEEYVRKLRGREDVFYVFKPFPLSNHENSFLTARAVMCASLQGKEWELREIVFRNQEACGAATPSSLLRLYAQEAGLNLTLYDECMEKNLTGPLVAKYFNEGLRAGVYATPTFFINGKPYVGPKAFEEWYNGEFKE